MCAIRNETIRVCAYGNKGYLDSIPRDVTMSKFHGLQILTDYLGIPYPFRSWKRAGWNGLRSEDNKEFPDHHQG